MATLYVRNVPSDVVERLETLAGRAGMSVSAYCARALGEVSRAAANPEILDALPHQGITTDAVVQAVDDGRFDRSGGSDRKGDTPSGRSGRAGDQPPGRGTRRAT